MRSALIWCDLFVGPITVIVGLAGLWLWQRQVVARQRPRVSVWTNVTLIALGLCELFGAAALASGLGIWFLLVIVAALFGLCSGFTNLFQYFAHLARNRESGDSPR